MPYRADMIAGAKDELSAPQSESDSERSTAISVRQLSSWRFAGKGVGTADPMGSALIDCFSVGEGDHRTPIGIGEAENARPIRVRAGLGHPFEGPSRIG